MRGEADVELFWVGTESNGGYGMLDEHGEPKPVFHAKKLCAQHVRYGDVIAFAPWDPHRVWFGGNVVFQTLDSGKHWTPISPDLTLNVKSHQQTSGGPINYDVSGAEASDTIVRLVRTSTEGEDG